MNGYLVRALVALLLAVFLFLQARSLGARPHRRRAFQLAGAGLLAFVAYNGALAAGAEIGPIQIAIAAIGVALFIGSIVSLVLSLNTGEMQDQRAQIAAAAREYREKREEQREQE